MTTTSHASQTQVSRPASTEVEPVVVWLTGLSGAGKSSIAQALQQALHERAVHSTVLDGDLLRKGINRDLGFTDADRAESVRRCSEVAKLMLDAGLVVITALISPFCEQRRLARETCAPHRFLEVFVDAPLATVEARDPKGLYKQARSGLIPHFTGIDSPYEAPLQPELHIDTRVVSVNEAVVSILDQLLAVWAPAEN